MSDARAHPPQRLRGKGLARIKCPASIVNRNLSSLLSSVSVSLSVWVSLLPTLLDSLLD